MCIRTAATSMSNRAYDTVDFDGKKIFPGGENNIAVFAIDQATGEPTLIQNEDVRGIYPRTFALDPSGRMLVVTNIEPMLVRDGAGLKTVPANIATYHVGPDGRLGFAHSYEVDTGDARSSGAAWWRWGSGSASPATRISMPWRTAAYSQVPPTPRSSRRRSRGWRR